MPKLPVVSGAEAVISGFLCPRLIAYRGRYGGGSGISVL